MLRRVRGLYAIVDCDYLAARGFAPMPFLERLLEAQPAAIQLRAKSAGARVTLALARSMSTACRAVGVPFFVNDRPDLALLSGSVGVHLGQHDLSLEDARRVGPSLQLGLSTHRLEQVESALSERPHYLAFGPVFATASKRDPEPVVGLAALASAAQRCRQARVPLVAIGGIDESRAAQVALAADAGAVISALLPAGGLPEVTATARRLHSALGGS
jgi:thiamine-phosphate pyrophosphorylase